MGKVIIFSAPSGSGKSTIVNHLLGKYPFLELSISATSRAPRGQERNGREYYFISTQEFEERIAQGRFVEYEQVYKGTYYGTLKEELERIWSANHIITFDVDVKGGVNLKKIFGDNALSIFIQAPSVEELHKRLVARGTDSSKAIEERVAKAAEEMKHAPLFDRLIVNDELDKAFASADSLIEEFVNR